MTYITPHVIVVGLRAKGAMAKHLDLDVYIDDNYDNALDVVQQSPKTRGYLLTHSYNSNPELYEERWISGYAAKSELDTVESRRVNSLEEFFQREGLLTAATTTTA